MNHFAISALITAVATFSLAIFVFTRNVKSRLYRVFALYSFSITLWSSCVAVHGFATSKDLSLVAAHLLHIGASLIPVTFLHFVFVLIEGGTVQGLKKRILQVLYPIAFFFIVASFSPGFVGEVTPRYGIPFLMHPGNVLYHLSVIYFCSVVFYGLCWLFLEYRNSSGIRHNQMKYLFWSSLFGYIGGVNNYLIIYDITIFPLNPYGTYAITLYVMITAYAVVKYRLMDIRVAAVRTAIFLLVYIPILILPFLIGYRINQGMALNWMLPSFLLILLAPPGLFLYLRVQRKAEERLRAKKLRYLQAIEKFLETVKKVRTLEELIDLVLSEATVLIGSRYAAFYLLDKEKKQYVLRRAKATKGVSGGSPVGTVEEDNCLIKYLVEKKEPMVKEVLRTNLLNLTSYSYDLIEREMAKLQANMIVPSFFRDEMICFIVLSGNKEQDLYSDEDNRAFSTLGTNVGLAVRNALFVEELNTLHSDLLASERLAAIGRLATSTKHEISNPLNIVYGSFQQAMMDIKDRQKGHKRAVEYLTSARDKTEKMLAELSPVKGITGIDVIAVYDRVLNALQRMEDKPTLEQCKGEQIDVLNSITQFIEGMHSFKASDEKEQEIRTELIHTAEVAHKHIAKVMDFDELLYEIIEKGFRGAGRISQAVNAIYHLPKELEQEAAAVNVKELIKESMAFTGFQSYWENLSKTGFEMRIPETLPDVKGYLNRLVSVFSNIFLNAYQAMTGAELTNTEERLIRIVAQISEDDPDMVEIRVANKGPLIPAGDLDKVFRQGYSTKEGNKGVGLDIAKTQVEVFHNGTISVRNIDDFGPEFVVRLPVWEGESAE